MRTAEEIFEERLGGYQASTNEILKTIRTAQREALEAALIEAEGGNVVGIYKLIEEVGG